MKIIGLVTARGGSKNLPRKNLHKIGEDTLVSKAVFDAYESGLIEKVFISSDSEEIIDSAKTRGAICLSIRKKELAMDDSTDREVIIDFLDEVSTYYEPYLIVHLRPTSPQRTPKLIQKVIKEFLKSKNKIYSSIRTFHEVTGSYLKLAKISANSEICPLGEKEFGYNIWGMPRQKLPNLAQGNGLVDILRPQIIRDCKSHYGDKVLGYKTDKTIDIDSKNDYDLVKSLLSP